MGLGSDLIVKKTQRAWKAFVAGNVYRNRIVTYVTRCAQWELPSGRTSSATAVACLPT